LVELLIYLRSSFLICITVSFIRSQGDRDLLFLLTSTVGAERGLIKVVLLKSQFVLYRCDYATV
jgi:hypothetical protein